MHPSTPVALALTAVLAVVARLVKAVDTSGAVAGFVVGAAVSVGHGLPGLGVLGTFFVGGTLATRLGWERKRAAGTAERGGGARDAGRVLGKGGIAAAAALIPGAGAAVGGALAAALADTLGTEFGVLSRGKPRTLPTLRPVAAGTPGAVSVVGLLGSALGAAVVAALALGTGVVSGGERPLVVLAALAAAGFGAALLESLLGGLWQGFARSPGWLRNVLTTAAGAGLGLVLIGRGT